MNIERLKNDPAYWDEVAPEGAAAYVEADPVANRSHEGVGFFAAEIKSGGSPTGWEGVKMDGTKFHVFADYWNIVLRPPQAQWRGPEEGLPPVGTVCEYQSDMWGWQAGDRVEVLAHRRAKVEPVAVVWNLRTKQAGGLIAGVLRPLRSDKERAVEAVLKATPCPTLPRTVEAVVGDLYDAGLLRLPEEQS